LACCCAACFLLLASGAVGAQQVHGPAPGPASFGHSRGLESSAREGCPLLCGAQVRFTSNASKIRSFCPSAHVSSFLQEGFVSSAVQMQPVVAAHSKRCPGINGIAGSSCTWCCIANMQPVARADACLQHYMFKSIYAWCLRGI
jgi:hypothetical protein